MSAPLHVMVLGAQPEYLTNLRGPLIRELVGAGYRVTAVGAAEHAAVREKLESWGAHYRVVRIERAGLNPIADLGALAGLYSLFRREKPDLVFAYTVKPIVYGLPMARLAGVKRRFAMIAGRGWAFMDGAEFKRRLSRTLATVAYRVGLSSAQAAAFQNEEDRELFQSRGILPKRLKTIRIFGSGVDLDHYAAAPLPEGPPTFLMIARLLRDKGVPEYAAAARIVKQTSPDARFLLVGPYDHSPNGLKPAKVEGWVAEGVIDYVGEVDDVRPQIARSQVYVLPSKYGEGVPRSALEALSTGRAVITTDAPGCRDTVIVGENGYLVRPGDAEGLAAAMLAAIENPQRLAKMGERSLTLARDRFDVRAVNADLRAMMGL